jgi:uncharacterized Zn finger protein
MEIKEIIVEYCKKCGWIMEYRPRSFQEHIKEIIGKQNRQGYLKCPNCGSIKTIKKGKKGEIRYGYNKSGAY